MKIGFFADAHGHLGPMRAGLRAMSQRGVDSIYFLGDSVGYSRSLEVVNYLAENRDSIKCLKGNHEDAVLKRQFSHDKEDVYQHRFIADSLLPLHRSFLSSWPESFSVDLSCGRALLVHGSPRDALNDYVYPDSNLEDFPSSFKFVLLANTHRPFIRECAGTTFVNVGSCSFPRDDGRFGAVAIMDSETGRVEIVRYPIWRFHRALRGKSHSAHGSIWTVLQRRVPREELVGSLG